jgi:hypothetical protein
MNASQLWRELFEEVRGTDAAWKELEPAIETILDHGPLAQRLLEALGASPDEESIARVWRQLSACLACGDPFLPNHGS